ncbi:MAG TPA: serine protease [Clostridiales bacterium]|nr:serine protease [Clostridiales bacterium]
MASEDKDKKYYFITEEVVEKKRLNNKSKKIIIIGLSLLIGIFIGLISAVTLVLTVPGISKKLYGEDKKEIVIPEDENLINPPHIGGKPNDKEIDNDEEEENKSNNNQPDCPDDNPIIVGNNTEDIDYIKEIYTEINNVIDVCNKSILKVSAIVDTKDIFDNPTERVLNTTGVIIANVNEEIYVLVSLDRVKGASSIVIEFTDFINVKAQILDYESDINLAIIKADISTLDNTYKNRIQTAKLGESNTISVGTPIIALGSPNGYPMSAAVGIISSKGSIASVCDNQFELFNTDIKNVKESDGIIINYDGDVIGIITRTFKDDLNKEINTAIGISKIKSLIIRMTNSTPRIYFGITASDMTETALNNYGITNGIYVTEVKAKSPAFISGIKNGDIIKQVGEQVVYSTNGFNRILSKYKAGDEIILLVERTASHLDDEIEISAKLVQKEK